MNEWIDARQHKPSTVDAGAKQSGNVLTFGPKGIAVGFYHAGMKAWINARGGTMSVTHWMAPPAFPEPDRKLRQSSREAGAPAEDEGQAASTEWARKMIAERFGDDRCPASSSEAYDARATAEKLGPFRPRAPSQSPEAKMARLEKKLAKLTGRVDDMEACAAGARKRAAEVADRMAAANTTLAKKVEEAMARIAVLEAGQFRVAPPPMWTTPFTTCGPDGR